MYNKSNEFYLCVYTNSDWIRNILKDLHQKQNDLTPLFCDNINTIYMINNLVFHGRSNHIETKYHFIRDLVQSHQIKLLHCRTKEQSADIFTKALPRDQFKKLKRILEPTNAHSCQV